GCSPPSAEGVPAGEKSYLFCFWNVENFFDDKVDGWRHPDKEYDEWFARDKKALDQKLENLCKVLLSLNDGKGPDILAVAEAESERAAELLREALNKRLRDRDLHYPQVVMKNPRGARHIATAIITRLKVQRDKTRLLGTRQRMLEAHLEANGHEL